MIHKSHIQATVNFTNFKMFQSNMLKITNQQFWTKHLWAFSLFSTTNLHCKWNKTKLLLPESECTSCLTGNLETSRESLWAGLCAHTRKKENPWNAWILWRVPNRLHKSQIWWFLVKKLQKTAAKYSIEKPSLLNFEFFFSKLLSKIVWGNRFSFLTLSRSLYFTFSENVIIGKGPFFFQIDF